MTKRIFLRKWHNPRPKGVGALQREPVEQFFLKSVIRPFVCL